MCQYIVRKRVLAFPARFVARGLPTPLPRAMQKAEGVRASKKKKSDPLVVFLSFGISGRFVAWGCLGHWGLPVFGPAWGH